MAASAPVCQCAPFLFGKSRDFLVLGSNDPFARPSCRVPRGRCRDLDWVRPYFMEPLLIAKDALADSNLPASVTGTGLLGNSPPIRFQGYPADEICLARTSFDYSKWNITNDLSLIGFTRAELTERLLDSANNEGTIGEWDSQGIEVITPIFDGRTVQNRSDACFVIWDYLNTLKHENYQTPDGLPSRAAAMHRAYDSVWTGSHVHIGFNAPTPDAIPFEFLQHLVFLILVNEPLISSLHPRARSGIDRVGSPPPSPTAGDPAPNFSWLPSDRRREALANYEEETHVRRLTRNWIAIPELRSNREEFSRGQGLGPNPTMAEIAQIIFAPNITLARLANMVCRDWSRGYLVNFTNIFKFCDGKNVPAPTVEFRQHGSTLDAAQMQHWVEFLFALMRLAEHNIRPTPEDPEDVYAYEQTYSYDRNKMRNTVMYNSIQQLCGPDFLNLPQDEIDYWVRSQQLYRQGHQDVNPRPATRAVGRRKGGVNVVTRAAKRTMERHSQRQSAEKWRRSELKKFLAKRPGKEQ